VKSVSFIKGRRLKRPNLNYNFASIGNKKLM